MSDTVLTVGARWLVTTDLSSTAWGFPLALPSGWTAASHDKTSSARDDTLNGATTIWTGFQCGLSDGLVRVELTAIRTDICIGWHYFSLRHECR
jgi:hypothetical protein